MVMWVWCNNSARPIKLSSVVGPVWSLKLWQSVCWHAWFGLHTATAEHHSRFWTVKTIKLMPSSITSLRQKSDLGAHDCCMCNGFIYYLRIVLSAHEVAEDSLNLLVLWESGMQLLESSNTHEHVFSAILYKQVFPFCLKYSQLDHVDCVTILTRCSQPLDCIIIF
jgi:hypothetical protein